MKRKILPYNPKLKELARKLRNNSTKSEVLLWQVIKGKKMRGYDFHRQKPLLNFIADFYCYELNLVIELDGYSHQFEDVQMKDKIKQSELKRLGLTLLRFDDNEVFSDMDNVVRVIEAYIDGFEKENDEVISRKHTP